MARISLALVLVVFWVASARAWNIPGHMLSGAIAYQILSQESPQTIEKVKAILDAHPWRQRWETSLSPLTGDDKDIMLFMLAARWADDIRTQDRPQSKPAWHYINPPFKPQGQPESVLAKPSPVPNIVTALTENQEIVRTSTDPSKRAIALAWLFHLVGDVHQPLHAVQLFSVDHLDGDRGGNQVCVRTKPDNEPINLHSYFDGIITTSQNLTVLKNLATSLRGREEFSKAELTELGATGFEDWVNESFDGARVAAYRGGAIIGAPRTKGADCPAIQAAPVLPQSYALIAKRVSDRRMILAGYRLADILTRILG